MKYKLIQKDVLLGLKDLQDESIDMIFVDPPYKLSNDGITCSSGKMVSVNKGEWDKSLGFYNDNDFNMKWISECGRVLKPNGTMWITGTYHIIHSIAFILLKLGYNIINEIVWQKPNAAPNIACRCFTASHELVLWVKKSKNAKHIFNYKLMKEMNNNKQMRSIWSIPTTPLREKKFGKHPTQKPERLLELCILSSTVVGQNILDPFCGSGTTGVVCAQYDRNFIGIDNSKEFIKLTKLRIDDKLEKKRINKIIQDKDGKPFLKWAGGKSSLLLQLQQKFPHELNNGKIETYMEPFVGAGAVLFDIISKHNLKNIIINDINSTLILSYKMIQKETESLIKFILEVQNKYNSMPVEDHKSYYYDLRTEFNELKQEGKLDKNENIKLAALMIIINKTCFNGLYRENKKGGFNVPFNNAKKLNIDIDNIWAVSGALKNVKILNSDFETIIKYADEKTFVYMDPPYRPLTETSSFNDYSKVPFDDNEQIRLAHFIEKLDKKGTKILLSNSDPQSVDENDLFFINLYKKFNINRVQAARMINSKGAGRGKISELLIHNY